MSSLALGTLIFVLVYVLIVVERWHKTAIALGGASLVLLLKLVTQEEAFHSVEYGVDWNVIFLIIGMMIIVSIMRETGVFQWTAIRSAKLGRGEPFRIMAILAVVTAVASAFLDNVTTVLLIAPVTIVIANQLEVDPVPYMIVEALASNIGGTATLIGDPPNIMIGSRAELPFNAFIEHLTPVVIAILIAFVISIRFIWGRNLTTRPELKARILAIDESRAITDKPLLVKSLVVTGLVVIGFILHHPLGFQPATIALVGAAVLLLWSKHQPHKALREVEWTSLFFFIGLFIIVGAVVKVGLVGILARKALALTEGNLFATSMLVLWFSAFASAIIDNIPYVATMNPLIIEMAKAMWPGQTGHALLHHADLLPIWWSLALGACLGGNGTAIGASANVIICGLSERAGYPITFRRFTLYGMPLMIESVIISTVYIWWRYY